MFSLLLFVPLAVFFVSDGAVLNNPKCGLTEQRPDFCKLMVEAYRYNKEVEFHLKEARAPDVEVRVSGATKTVLEILKATTEEGLLTLLRKALDLETWAMLRLKTFCDGEQIVERICKLTTRGIYATTLNLIKGIIDIAEGDLKVKIRAYYEEFVASGAKSDGIYDLGTQILKAIDGKEQ